MTTKVLILGVNGFIGHHLSARILKDTNWSVFGMDMTFERIDPLLANPRMKFFEGDITINKEWIEYHIRKCDVVLPLVAIATPATYVKEPLRVFELDFEANLPIIRQCVRHGKRVLFPSTSEVYGMCRDSAFDPASSELVYGPIEKQRWIYACSKQLMDRVIYAYGSEVKVIDTTAGEYYGKGYQDVSNRVPKIDNPCAELGWEPRITMREALQEIFEAYRGQLPQASHLLD